MSEVTYQDWRTLRTHARLSIIRRDSILDTKSQEWLEAHWRAKSACLAMNTVQGMRERDFHGSKLRNEAENIMCLLEGYKQ